MQDVLTCKDLSAALGICGIWLKQGLKQRKSRPDLCFALCISRRPLLVNPLPWLCSSPFPSFEEILLFTRLRSSENSLACIVLEWQCYWGISLWIKYDQHLSILRWRRCLFQETVLKTLQQSALNLMSLSRSLLGKAGCIMRWSSIISWSWQKFRVLPVLLKNNPFPKPLGTPSTKKKSFPMNLLSIKSCFPLSAATDYSNNRAE